MSRNSWTCVMSEEGLHFAQPHAQSVGEMNNMLLLCISRIHDQIRELLEMGWSKKEYYSSICRVARSPPPSPTPPHGQPSRLTAYHGWSWRSHNRLWLATVGQTLWTSGYIWMAHCWMCFQFLPCSVDPRKKTRHAWCRGMIWMAWPSWLHWRMSYLGHVAVWRTRADVWLILGTCVVLHHAKI